MRVGLRESSHGESKRAEAARAPGEDVGTEQSSQQVKANLRSSSGRTITAKIDPRVIEESLQFQRQQVNAAAQHAPGSGETDHAALGVKPPSSSKMSLPLMLAMTLIMSMLSGVGAAPYLFTGKLNPYWSGIANAVGCGVMLAASFDLLEEAKPFSPKLVMGGIALGIIAMKLSQEYLEQYEDVSFSDLQVSIKCLAYPMQDHEPCNIHVSAMSQNGTDSWLEYKLAYLTSNWSCMLICIFQRSTQSILGYCHAQASCVGQ